LSFFLAFAVISFYLLSGLNLGWNVSAFVVSFYVVILGLNLG